MSNKWVLVPKKLTKEMLGAACASHPKEPYSPSTTLAEIIEAEWDAAIKVRPYRWVEEPQY